MIPFNDVLSSASHDEIHFHCPTYGDVVKYNFVLAWVVYNFKGLCSSANEIYPKEVLVSSLAQEEWVNVGSTDTT
jgi:hypothetical protein